MACADYQDKASNKLNLKRSQCDEIWSFLGAKAKKARQEQKEALGYGVAWTWAAMDDETKLVPCWLVGERTTEASKVFISNHASRLVVKVKLTTDGHHPYLEAIEDAFGGDIDYAMLIELYSASGGKKDETRYSRAEYRGYKTKTMAGEPNPVHVSTSYIESQNLIVRMSVRRFTGLTNGFSKKIENHAHAILHYVYCNVVRVHKGLRCTPAMPAGVTNRLLENSDIVALMPEHVAKE